MGGHRQKPASRGSRGLLGRPSGKAKRRATNPSQHALVGAHVVQKQGGGKEEAAKERSRKQSLGGDHHWLGKVGLVKGCVRAAEHEQQQVRAVEPRLHLVLRRHRGISAGQVTVVGKGGCGGSKAEGVTCTVNTYGCALACSHQMKTITSTLLAVGT